MGKGSGGGISDEWMGILDHKLEELIESKAGSQTRIKLIYSTEEHTYPEHILPLIEKLDKCHILHEDQIESFKDHSVIGSVFKKTIMDYFNV